MVELLTTILLGAKQTLRSELTSVHRTYKLLNIPQTDAEELIQLSYQMIVQKRQCAYRNNNQIDDAINSASKWLTTTEVKPSLLIQGTIGSGKTTLAKAICNAVRKYGTTLEDYIEKNSYKLTEQQRKQIRSISDRIPATTLLTAIQVNDSIKQGEKFSSLCSTAGILVIDDLGQEETIVKDYGTTRNPIIELINIRYDKRLPMILTTNLDDSGIIARYGERIIDRLREACNTITITGESYRR